MSYDLKFANHYLAFQVDLSNKLNKIYAQSFETNNNLGTVFASLGTGLIIE